VHLGKDVQIVNHSCYPDDSAEPGESDVWRLYLKVYRTMSHVAIREPVSFALMSRAGIAATQSFDCLPLTVARHGAARWEPRRDDVVLAGSAALRDEDLPPWVEFVERLGATGRRVRVLIGASMYPADDDAGFLHRLSAGVSRPVEIVRAASLADWLDTIAGAAAVVSGRFHYSIAAAALGTPFVLLGSNSPKNLGLAERLGVLPPLPLDAPGLADQLIARVEALGAEGEDPARAADRLAGLCADAEKNFLALPPV
jgi:polysaccharide pyruvyl transferase WcaK-like protein